MRLAMAMMTGHELARLLACDRDEFHDPASFLTRMEIVRRASSNVWNTVGPVASKPRSQSFKRRSARHSPPGTGRLRQPADVAVVDLDDPDQASGGCDRERRHGQILRQIARNPGVQRDAVALKLSKWRQLKGKRCDYGSGGWGFESSGVRHVLSRCRQRITRAQATRTSSTVTSLWKSRSGTRPAIA